MAEEKEKEELEPINEVRGRAEIHDVPIVVIGDLHISATFSGQHKNYQEECLYNFDRIEQIVKEEKAGAVIFLGDLVGVNEKNIRDHQFLTRMLMFFKNLNRLTNNQVYSVKGNHDMGDFTDFDMLIGLGYIKNPKYIDYYYGKNLEVRFHLVNYGDEYKSLPLTGNMSNAADYVLGHSDYYIEGVTNWYSKKGSTTPLDQLDNFIGVGMVFSGHIHAPSSEVLDTVMKDGSSISLFYTGAPGRVVEHYDDCWYVLFKHTDGFTNYEAKPFGLKPASEVFYETEEEDPEDDMSEEAYNKAKSDELTTIVQEIMSGRLTSGDLYHQIDLVPGARPEVKQLAKEYLDKAGAVKK